MRLPDSLVHFLFRERTPRYIKIAALLVTLALIMVLVLISVAVDALS